MTEQTQVDIQLTSRIEREQEPDEVTKHSLNGQLMEKGDAIYLSYLEEVPDIGESSHAIKITPNRALIMRKGPVSMRLPLILGHQTAGDYQSPLGPFSMLAKMERCEFEWDGGSGRLLIVYDLQLQNQYAGKFTLEFKLKAR